MFETTIAGSLPKPAWLAEPEKLWAAWRHEGATLERVIVNDPYDQHPALDAPSGIWVNRFAGEDALAYGGTEWPDGSRELFDSAQELAEAAENVANLPLTSFHGCYQMNAITID